MSRKNITSNLCFKADRKAGKKKPAKKAEEATEGNQKKSFTAVITCGLCG